MSATLAFTELVPERDRIEIAKGEYLELLSMAELDAIDAARAMAIQKQIEVIDTGEMSEANARALNDALGEMLTIILPDLAPEQLAGLKTGQRVIIIRFWSDNNQPAEASKNGKSQA